MSDDSGKAEEERIQRAMNRKTRASMVVQPSHRSNEPFAPVNSFTQKQPTAAVKPTPVPEKVKPLQLDKPKATPSVTFNQQTTTKNSSEMESLQLKKRTILGTIGTTRREIEEVRSEIAKLKNKEAELNSLLEKREAAVQQLTQEIDSLEQKDQSENLKRKEEEKSKRVNFENERRRKEEEDEERKKNEFEQDKKVQNPQPLYSPRSAEEDLNEDGLNAEELRIMRAMSRPGKNNAPTAGGRVSSVKQSSAVNSAKPAMSEADRQRIAEENKKKEDENRASQEKDLQQRIAHLQTPGGVKKTFCSSMVYDFDAEVKFIADFTNFEEIPITTPIDNNFTYSVTWHVKPGFHFYLFKINGKTEINKNIPTGLAPNGSLMNKIEC